MCELFHLLQLSQHPPLTILHLHLLFSRCSPTEHLFSAQTYWTTQAVWLCWWWVFCCSLLCWSWPSLPTVVWPDTSSWACVSYPTAALCTKTCLRHVTRRPMEKAVVVKRAHQRGREREAFGCKKILSEWEEGRKGEER